MFHKYDPKKASVNLANVGRLVTMLHSPQDWINKGKWLKELLCQSIPSNTRENMASHLLTISLLLNVLAFAHGEHREATILL